jgi:hypothetical protein
MKGVGTYEDFYAICNHEPPETRHAVRVGGAVVFLESGWSARLERTEGNTGINPVMLHLDLILIPPPPDSSQADVLDRQDLEEWREAPPLREYQEVEFHVKGTDDDPPPVMKVQHPE